METMTSEQHPGGEAGPEKRQASRRRRFLVAEDDPEMRALIVYVLRQDGADVLEAKGGSELLEWAELTARTSRRDLFDAIISDIQMPDLTALDVLSKVPRMAVHTPVILVTAFGDKETRLKAYDLGAAMVLRKPLDLDDLRALVRGTVSSTAS